MNFRHDEKASKFYLDLDDEPAYVAYEEKNGVLDLQHTVVPPQHEGKGIASKLVTHVFDWARKNDKRVIPSCPYVSSWLDRHPDGMDVIAGEK